VIDRVNESRQPVVVTQNGEAKAVIQDIQSYEETRNTIVLFKMIVVGEEEIRKGELSTHEETVERLAWKLFG